ncbi:MAG: polysaccharide deacetylase family protein [Armatimonadetes bacterium]|nr:polysaccharide deacetylase family protein [Armatimonadota bacterium]MDW8029468.1 polysaccharide deacetylase family protein [Armatimonadota bacterium]
MNLRQSSVRIWLRQAVAVFLPPKFINGSLRILTYHRVRPDADDPRSITPQRFKEQLKVLKEGWRVVSLDDVLKAIEGKKILPQKAVLITFDDGYADLYEHAMPLLLEFGFSALVFMLARYVGRVGRTYSEANYPEAPFLSASQLQEMEKSGIEIGSHGLWHVPLSRLTIKEAEKEITESKRILSEILGKEIRAFSYPWGRAGDFGKEHVEMVAKAGYKVAFTMLHGLNKHPFEPFRLRRCHVYPWDDARLFKAILEGRFDGWCLKNSELWNQRKKLLRKLLMKSPMRDGSGRKF